MGIKADVTLHPAWWHRHAGVSFGSAFFDDPEYRLEADCRMRRVLFEKFGQYGLGEERPEPRPILGSDLIASGYLHSMLLGCPVRFAHGNPPEVLCANLSDDAVLGLQPPDLTSSPVWQATERQIDWLLARFGRVEPCVNLMGVQNVALDLRGQQLYMDYYENPLLAHRLLSVCAESIAAVGLRLRGLSGRISGGVTAIVNQTAPDVYLTSNCTVEMVSRQIYEEFLLCHDRRLAALFQPFGIHHCGQTMEHVSQAYAQVAGLAFAEVGAGSDLAAVRRHMPGVHLNARVSPVWLAQATYEEISSAVHALIEAGRPENLLSVSCVGIDASVEDGQVIRFLQACQSQPASVPQ